MKQEWTIQQIRDFVKKDYQSVAARMTKCLLSYLDESASLPSSSVTGEEWKEKFKDWLVNNMQFTSKSNVEIIADHVERYIVKSTPVTGESEGERKFTLKEALDIWDAGFEYVAYKGMTDLNGNPPLSRKPYFKDKFGIDI